MTGQQLDYLRTALKALDVGNENQYQIRGHSHFDKVNLAFFVLPKYSSWEKKKPSPSIEDCTSLVCVFSFMRK